MSTIEEIKKLAQELDNPKLAKQDPGMVIQVWQDGEITCQKCGELLWERTLHCFKTGHPKNKVEMPHKHTTTDSYAFVTREDANKISDMIFSL